ncbi:LacI family DNA-binding transcriptional regulator [Paenibacillus sp. M1]|uniref:LacI family DNA-binding transcriptional regulator n=1 Tax=Paenibacillus haidiansis TaxID=1574488 RepID=A0ABU7VSB4_9BACL
MIQLATIKEIAKQSGVSIATVSHVINKTRYVSPELVDKVEAVMKDLGYDKKIKEADNHFKIGKQSEIALVLPRLEGTLYAKLTSHISSQIAENGYNLTVYFHNDDITQEKTVITNILNNKRIAGAIIVPASKEAKQFGKLVQQQIPFVFLDRTVRVKGVDSVIPDSKGGIFKGCTHLLKSGHEQIALIIEQGQYSTSEDRVEGYKEALDSYKIPFSNDLLVEVDPDNIEDFERKIKTVWVNHEKPAFVATGNRMTLNLLKVINKLGLECPTDVSVIGFGDEEWSEIINPPLTILKQDTEEMAKQAVDIVLGKLEKYDDSSAVIKIPLQFSVQKSTQVIGKGPFGEKPVTPEELTLTKEETQQLMTGGYKVGISFHYGGTAWTRLYENGIRNILEKHGISIVSITNADFDPLLQVTQLEGLRMQKPDAIIAIPVDDEITAKKFQSISEETKLIFMSSVPEGMTKDQYSSCVSVNERENGQNMALLLGDYFKNKRDVKIGFIGHGAPFYGTHLRDAVASDIIRSSFNNIRIVDEKYFYRIENTYEVCKKMMTDHPEIQGLYISWDRPALEAIKALKELKREDVAIFTSDLDLEIATYLANEEMVKGLSSQRPYQQGIAVGLATAKALLGHDEHKYIGVPPYIVQSKNLLKSWKDIILEPAPPEIEELILNKFT